MSKQGGDMGQNRAATRRSSLAGRLAVLFLLLAAGTAQAQAPTVTLRGYALGSDLSIDESVHAADSLRGKPGFGLDVEYRPIRKLGIDVSFGDLRVAVKTIQVVDEVPQQIVETRGSIRWMPVLLGLYVHPVRLSWVDPYVGPVIGWMFYQGDFPGRRDSEAAFGGVLGFDVPFRARGWAAGASARFLHTKFPAVEEFTSVINTFQVGAGVSYRW
jgi:hypothetical protein